MIDFEKPDILIADGVRKKIEVSFDDSSFSNESIYSEQFKIDESICSNSSLRFGGCEAKSVKFRITKKNNIANLKGKWIDVNRIYFDGEEKRSIKSGHFKVDSDISTSDKSYRDITAYNLMYDILKTDVSKWYNGLVFPLSIKDLRNGLFEYLGVAQEEVELPNDIASVHSIDYSENILAGTILKDICELNGCFGVVDNSDVFRYIFLKKNTDYKVTKKMYRRGDLRYENYKTSLIDGIVLGQNASDKQIEYIFDETINPYYIKTRILNLGDSDESLGIVAKNLYETISDIQFVPLSLNCVGNQCVECGDYITVVSDEGEVGTYILSRTLTGIQSLKDNYESLVSQYYTDEYSNDDSTMFLNSEIQKLKKDNFYTYVFTNSDAYDLDDSDVVLVQYNIYATEKTDVVFMATIPVWMDMDGEIVINYAMDKAKVKDAELRQYLHKGNNFVTIVNYLNAGENDRFTLEVMAHLEYVESMERKHEAKIISFENYISTGTYEEVSVDDTIPTGRINENKIKAVLFSRGIGATNNWDGTISFAESINVDIDFKGSLSFDTENFRENIDMGIQSPSGGTFNENVGAVAFSGRLVFENMNAYVNIGEVIKEYVFSTENADKYMFDEYITTNNDMFALKTIYTYDSVEETIDSGKMCSVAMDYSGLNVESVVVENV